jgi:hypothetical protein
MGYEFHITRRPFWDDEGPEITAEEWLQYVRGDTELETITSEGPHFVLWNGPSKLAEPWLDWLEGEIYSEDADRALVDKMISIAEKLKAEVQGDDGETYSDSSDVIDPGEDTGKSDEKRPFWKKLFGG